MATTPGTRSKTDVKVVNGKNYWWDMYSNELVLVSSGHGGLNIEHSVANSWWEGTKNDAYKDIHHLNPSNATANSRKGNFPLGKVGTVTWTNGVTTVGKPTGAPAEARRMSMSLATNTRGTSPVCSCICSPATRI